MRHRSLLLVVAASLLLALPAAAEVYTIRLSNGTVFESRYQPKQASWDPTQVTFVDETGTEISLPQALIVEVTAQSETKGYGRVIDTTTIDLGYMPNDLDQSQQLMQQQAQMASPLQQLFASGQQASPFLEPGELSTAGGVPFGFSGFPGGIGAVPGGFNPGFPATPGFIAPSGTTPAPFTTPTNTTTPAPFTIPSPATAPFTIPSPGTAPPTTTTTTPQ